MGPITEIQLRRDTAANWTASNPILALGEIGIETDTHQNKLGDGVSVWSVLPYWMMSIATLAGATGAANVGYLPSGTGAVVTNVQAKLQQQTVSVLDFGADPTGATDSTAAFNLAITYCSGLLTPYLVIPPGLYLLASTITFNLPDYATIEFFGQIKSSVSGAPAVILGSTVAGTLGLKVRGLSVTRTALDGAGTSIGVKCLDLVRGDVEIRKAYGFYEGVRVTSKNGAYGNCYSQYKLGQLASNTINLRLTVENATAGFTNENIFYGGNLTHFSDYTGLYPATATVNLQLDNNTGTGGPLNGNKFIGPSMEDTTASAIGAIINGTYNAIFAPRLENGNNQFGYQIQLTANSSFCSIVGRGYWIGRVNISDLGSCNSWDTQTTSRISNAATTTAGDATLEIQSFNNSLAHVLSILDSGGTEQAYILGNGAAKVLNISIRNLIIRAPAQIYVANGSSATYTIPGSQTYAYINTSVATLNVIFPAAASMTDGTVISFAASLAQTGMTLTCAGASFPGIYSGAFALAANTALRFIYNAANTMWFPF